MTLFLLYAPLQAAADTVYMAAPQSTLQIVTDISVVLMATVATVVLLAVALFLHQVRELLGRLHDQIEPAAERTREAAKNVEYISAVVREDIQKVHEAVSSVADRLKDASDQMEDRVQEFNALMEVVQGEAERVFIDTASVVRGMQEGARRVGEGRRAGVAPEAEKEEEKDEDRGTFEAAPESDAADHPLPTEPDPR